MTGKIILLVIVFAISISVHESSHAYMAWRCGDSTAKRKGRISINPLDHVDPIGTILVPILLLATLGVPFGWAKPVPVNPAGLRNPRRDRALVAGAGPGSNFLLAFGSMVLCIIFAPLLVQTEIPLVEPLAIFLLANTLVNLLLGVFNLLPVPPLDGGDVIQYFLSRKAVRWMRENQAVLIIGLMGLWITGILGEIFLFVQTLFFGIQQEFISLIWGWTVARDLISLW